MSLQKVSIIIIIAFILSSCGLYRPTDVREVPVNERDRVKKNLKEGRGLRLDTLGQNRGGEFQFSSSNEMWRATLSILDFMPLSDVDYGGGIIITDWYSASDEENTSIKIIVRFLSNEIRSDGINVNVYKKNCSINANCSSNLIQSEIASEIKLEILKKAALIKKSDLEKK